MSAEYTKSDGDYEVRVVPKTFEAYGGQSELDTQLILHRGGDRQAKKIK